MAIKKIDELDTLLKDFLQPFQGSVLLRMLGLPISRVTVPLIDIEDTNDKFLVKVDMPGVSKEDISISIKGDTLEIKAEKKEEKKEEDAGFLRKERTYKNYYRSLTLPEPINTEKINATFDNGVLNIEIPKAEKKEEKKIEIK